jgi:hypothetical protein
LSVFSGNSAALSSLFAGPGLLIDPFLLRVLCGCFLTTENTESHRVFFSSFFRFPLITVNFFLKLITDCTTGIVQAGD